MRTKFFGYTKRNIEIIIGFILIAAIIGFVFLRKQNVQKFGVYTIARVESYEAESDGSDTHLTVYINGTEVKTTIGNGRKEMVGFFYFVKILKANPSYEVILSEEKVPDCILNNKIPNDGWSEIPQCK